MLTPERHRIILELLEERTVVKLNEFVEATDSSESTIRRDLSQLEEAKKLKRVHGGASLLRKKGEELSISEKSTKNLTEKDSIAKHAAGIIQDGDCIFLDAGTTTYQMIQYISAKDVKIVTNGLTHIEALLEKDIETYLTGGYIKQKTRALIGRGAIEGLSSYQFDKTFIGVNGIHPTYGFTTPDPEEAAIKNLAIHLGQEVYVLADSSKFHDVTFAKVAKLEEAIVITNEIDAEMLECFKEKLTIEVVTT
jgi:DeoR family transcriptional regulator, fructose operon transcriptional repressor